MKYEDKGIDWQFCQDNSDLILSSGINQLINSAEIRQLDHLNKIAGNYIISLDNDYLYIGEANNI